jgi:hypothetical protein
MHLKLVTRRKKKIVLLKNVTEKVSSREHTIIMGYFIAQVGADTSSYENIVRKFGEGSQNQEEKKLLDLCNRNQ